MALKLSLKPDERVLVNGVWLRNGARKGVLLVESSARIVRGRLLPRSDGAEATDRATDRAEALYAEAVWTYTSTEESGERLARMHALARQAVEALSRRTPAGQAALPDVAAAGDGYAILRALRDLIDTAQAAPEGRVA